MYVVIKKNTIKKEIKYSICYCHPAVICQRSAYLSQFLILQAREEELTNNFCAYNFWYFNTTDFSLYGEENIGDWSQAWLRETKV